ncbi:MAG: DUF2752 domain-containing protein [Planctomycetes bacterium]|nr:DUF2752 domain-containing protein [Planctomycetota bacterium]
MSDERKVPWIDRSVAIAILASAVVTVWFLHRVTPDARGHGTHEQFGMLRCSWPEQYDAPCPTCGCTTAAAYVVHFSPWDAIVTQPFGALVAIVGLWFAGLALYCLIRGESLVERMSLWNFPRIFLLGVAAALAGWAYKWLTWPSVSG